MTAEINQEVYAASDLTLKTKKRHINPRSETQGAFIEAMNKYEMVFGLGPAGTGKTFLAVAKAVDFVVDNAKEVKPRAKKAKAETEEA